MPWQFFKKYQLIEKIPSSIRKILQDGENGLIQETVKENDPCLERVQNVLIASNNIAAEAAIKQAQKEGFNTLLLTTYLQGEAQQVGIVLGGILRQIAETGQPLQRPACLVAGGETTVTLKGNGLGGRNQEVALGAVTGIAGLKDVAIISLGPMEKMVQPPLLAVL